MGDINTLERPTEIVSRRLLLSGALGICAAVTAAPAIVAQTTARSDDDLMNFSLNVTYLLGQYLRIGLTGAVVPVQFTRGVGINPPAGGAVTGGRRLTITDRVTELVVRNVDRRNSGEPGGGQNGNIQVLRDTLFSNAVRQPAIDISPAVFTRFMQMGGVIGAGATFDPYASIDNFLLGAYLLADVAVTADRGVANRISEENGRNLMLTLMASRAASAVAIRALLYRLGLAVPSLLTDADRIAAQRDRYDGSSTLDAGLSSIIVSGERVSRVVPGNGDALVAARSPEQVLNVLYMTNSSATTGGFFPEGTTGNIRTSAAN